jgi:hypothetical protein
MACCSTPACPGPYRHPTPRPAGSRTGTRRSYRVEVARICDRRLLCPGRHAGPRGIGDGARHERPHRLPQLAPGTRRDPCSRSPSTGPARRSTASRGSRRVPQRGVARSRETCRGRFARKTRAQVLCGLLGLAFASEVSPRPCCAPATRTASSACSSLTRRRSWRPASTRLRSFTPTGASHCRRAAPFAWQRSSPPTPARRLLGTSTGRHELGSRSLGRRSVSQGTGCPASAGGVGQRRICCPIRGAL